MVGLLENGMSIPPFDSFGNLPEGIHQASLTEVTTRFGTGTPQRQAVASRVERIFRVAIQTGSVARFIIFGSFVTDKDEPNDADIFMLMEDAFDASRLAGETALLFDHQSADAYFGASVFWLRRLAAWEGEQAAVEYWQVTRAGGRRGIIEVVPEQS